MRISSLKTTIVSLPVEPAIVTPLHNIASVENVLVEIGTDDGVTGIAYLWCFGTLRARALERPVVTPTGPRQSGCRQF